MSSQLIREMKRFAREEGKDCAIKRLEQWRETLTDLLELQLATISPSAHPLMREVESAINAVVADEYLDEKKQSASDQ